MEYPLGQAPTPLVRPIINHWQTDEQLTELGRGLLNELENL